MGNRDRDSDRNIKKGACPLFVTNCLEMAHPVILKCLYGKIVEMTRIPKHVAIIMDGNRRWAQKRGLPLEAGHWEGAKNLTFIVEEAAKMGVKVLTVYSFSTENWSRPKEEVDGLMKVFETYLISMRPSMLRDGVRLEMIGDLEPFPEAVKRAFYETKELTKNGDRIALVLALNYGGRDDLRRAMLKMIGDLEAGKIQKSGLTEKMISKYLDTANFEDPELLIRTSGERRISNFLLWQISYSEVYVSDVLWPDFTRDDFHKAIIEFQKRERRLGG